MSINNVKNCIYNPTPVFVGYPWTWSPKTWPGYTGIDGVTNYYKYNKYVQDPPNIPLYNSPGGFITGGGKKNIRSRKNIKYKKGKREKKLKKSKKSKKSKKF